MTHAYFQIASKDMLLIRVFFLAFITCFHVVGAAVLFRRYFPRESPWLGFFVPMLALLCALNFLEHFIALPTLGWLLPFTLGGLLWVMLKPGYSWDGLKLPCILLVLIFAFILAIKAIHPDIANYTEGTADFARILDFSLGDKLPATDSWIPPYDHGSYYTFQHYGASVMKRLFGIDIGSSYNLGFTLLAALTCVVGAGAAYTISGRRVWVSLATVLVLLGGFSGSSPLLFFYSLPNTPDYPLSWNLNDGWDDPNRPNPLRWVLAHDSFHPGVKLLPPLYSLYYSEFHANLAGSFVIMASILAASLIFKTERSDWPWVCLVILPWLTIIAAAWYFLVVLFFCGSSLLVALLARRRPQDWTLSLISACVGLALLWPSVSSLITASFGLDFYWTPKEEHTSIAMFLVQWWPVFIPWLLLCFVWHRLDLFGRWLHLAVAFVFIFVEMVTFGDRHLTTEKMWGAIYGAGLISLLPLVFMRPGLVFRFFSVFVLLASLLVFGSWMQINSGGIDWKKDAFHIEGDAYLQDNSQFKRLLQVLSRLHGATVLAGKSYWSYNEAPALIGFTENRCYIAWFYQETQCGHGGEADYRDKMDNDFYAGTMKDPLSFLVGNDIAAVVIWPEDEISDDFINKMREQIGSDYFYVDCKMDGPHNAGVFLRHAPHPSFPKPETPAPKPEPVPAPKHVQAVF